MATIDKKLIHFKSLSDFEARLAAGDILSTSIVWIKDAKKIWTHGEYYDCNGGGDNVYIFNPEGVASEEYAGLQNAVNNGKTVVIWAENAGAAPVVCTVVYGFYSPDAYFVSYAQAIVSGEDGATNYASMNVSQTAIESIGMVSAPIISSLKTINGESILGSGNIAIEGGETLTEADILAMGFTKNAGTITGVSANGTSVATSGVANIPAASTSKYGVTKLSSATNSSSTSLAATASAVKAAYDLANGKVGESDIFENKTDGIIKAEALYNDKSQGGLIYALPTSRLALEDDCDDVLVARSEIFAGSPEQSMLQADAFYETTTGTIYGLPTSSIVTNGGEDEILATQSYVDNAVANAGGGGGSSSGSGAYSEVNHGTSDTTFTLTPNVFHIWDEVANLTLTLGTETSGVANEFLFQFTSGATATSLALPDDIKWVSELAVEPNMIYQVSILKGLASVLEFNNAIVLIDNLCTYDGNKTVTFQYPVASDVSVYIGSSINMSTEVQLSAGETTATLVGMAEPGSSIVAINPMRDDTYNYIF